MCRYTIYVSPYYITTLSVEIFILCYEYEILFTHAIIWWICQVYFNLNWIITAKITLTPIKNLYIYCGRSKNWFGAFQKWPTNRLETYTVNIDSESENKTWAITYNANDLNDIITEYEEMKLSVQCECFFFVEIFYQYRQNILRVIRRKYIHVVFVCLYTSR